MGGVCFKKIRRSFFVPVVHTSFAEGDFDCTKESKSMFDKDSNI